jgi:hypothetical protein
MASECDGVERPVETASKSAKSGAVRAHHGKDRSMHKMSTVGLDLAKSVFQVHAIAEDGTVLVRRSLRRSQVLAFFGQLAACRVGLEACGSAHAWARALAALGHRVKMMPPASVKPLRQAPPDRCRRCRSALRGGVPADQALRADQDR